MKKCCLGLAMMASFVFAPVAMSAPLSGTFVTSPAPLTAASAKNGYESVAPTDIVVINMSPYLIYYSVPGTKIDDPLYSGQASYIREYNRAFYLTVNIEDSAHTVFWSRLVCPQAIVVVSSLSPDGVGLIKEHC
jgi:hypothetical protein